MILLNMTAVLVGHGKLYTSGLDSRTIELSRPIELTLGVDTNDMFTDCFETLLTESAFALPKNYIINDGATILFWKDGTKTIVKRSKDEKFDKRLGFLTAYFQKHCSMSKTKANKFLDNLVVEDVKKKEK